MSRLNLTLDEETSARLARLARESKTARATLARTLLKGALDARDAAKRRRKLAADYAAGRDDARELLEDFASAQSDLLE